LRDNQRTVFRLGRVSAHTLDDIAANAASAEPTYTEIGATRHAQLPPGYHHGRYQIRLPERPDVFDRAVHGLRSWVPHKGAGLTVVPDAPPRQGATVAVAAPLGPITAVAVCRIVYVIDEADQFGFAYGTLPGHPERGEEAFIVRRTDDGAEFTIVVFSQPAELLARAGGPITRRIQATATRRYLGALHDFAEDDKRA
jgi:uncharacterized protein (UPF0548 family)